MIVVVLRKTGEMYYAFNALDGCCMYMGADRRTVAMNAIEDADTIIIDSSFKEK